MRFVIDNPTNNTETLLNFAYMGKDRCVKLREVSPAGDDWDLCEFIAAECGSDCSVQEVMEGGCNDCGRIQAYLYTCAVQAAELRERLRKYELAEFGLDVEEESRQQRRKFHDPAPEPDYTIPAPHRIVPKTTIINVPMPQVRPAKLSPRKWVKIDDVHMKTECVVSFYWVRGVLSITTEPMGAINVKDPEKKRYFKLCDALGMEPVENEESEA